MNMTMCSAAVSKSSIYSVVRMLQLPGILPDWPQHCDILMICLQASLEFQAATASLADIFAIGMPGSDARIQACGGVQLLTQLMSHGPPGVQGPATAALAALCAPSLATSQASCQNVLSSDALHYLGALLDASDLRTRTSVLALLCPLSWQGPEASRAISAIIGLYR